MSGPLTLASQAASSLAPCLALDLLCSAVVVQGVYLRRYLRREYAFTYWILNLVTFAVVFVLSDVRIEVGLSLGLFAVFGILRYRTEALRIRDLTYLFIVIGFAILNGVARSAGDLVRVAMIDVAVLAAVVMLEFGRSGYHEDTVVIRYDRTDLLVSNQRAALLADLSQRLGLDCRRVIVENVDLMHDSAELIVTYRIANKSTGSP